MVGTEAADLGIEVELAGRGREAASQREGAIPALRNHLGVDGVQLPAGSPIVMQHGAAVDHGEMIRTVRDQREQGIPAVRRRRALIRGPVDLEDRPHQPDVADPDLAAQQGQGAQPKIDPVDPEPGPAASPIAAGDPGLRQGQGRGRQQAEVDAPLDRHGAAGDRLCLPRQYPPVVVPVDQKRCGGEDGDDHDDQQDQRDDKASQDRSTPGARRRQL